jgi:hypothetical protein
MFHALDIGRRGLATWRGLALVLTGFLPAALASAGTPTGAAVTLVHQDFP